MKPAIVIVACVLVLSACTRERGSEDRAPQREPAQAAQPAQSAALPNGLSRVTDTSLVCMANDQFMGRAQIPIEVQGRTYYGCCPMCKDRLANQPELRTATDPVTKEPVDKATAVIAQNAAGKVLYFTSEDTLLRYRQ